MLITAAQVITGAVNNKNLDPLLIKDDYILAAELDYLRPRLGDDFYDAIVATPGTYTTLLVYIRRALAFYVLLKALPFIHFHLASQGIMVAGINYAAPVTDQQRSDLATMCENLAEVHMREMERYLANNLSTYTLYGSDITTKIKGGIIMH